MPNYDACRSCGRPIRWTETEKGKRMPVDPEPVRGGNLKLHPIPRPTIDGYLTTVEISQVITPDKHVDAYISHFATCPAARNHRKGRTRA